MSRAGILSWEVVQRGEKLNLVTDLVSRDGMRERGSCLYIHICGLGHHAAKQSNIQSINRWGQSFFGHFCQLLVLDLAIIKPLFFCVVGKRDRKSVV